MREIEVFVDEDAWVYVKLKKDDKFIDIICIENFEEDKSVSKSLKLRGDLIKVNKILVKLYYCFGCDRLTVKSRYEPYYKQGMIYSSDSIKEFITYREKEEWEICQQK